MEELSSLLLERSPEKVNRSANQTGPNLVEEASVKVYRYQEETLVDAPLAEVFDFFSRAENLQRLTPEILRFEILTPMPIEMRAGTLIDYKLRLHGIPMTWRTEITVWEPGVRFVDSQIKGPYRQWIHEHRFQAKGDQTRMWDTVDYALPSVPFAGLVQKLFVEKRVEEIFRYRQQTMAQIFPARSGTF